MPRGWEKSTARRTAVLQRRRYLIVCEDEKSSLDYLMSFEVPKDFAEIVSEGGAGNTISVVEKALALKEEAERQNQPFVNVWCVIDRDEFPKDRYRAAFNRVKGMNDVKVIWANEAFELWYLLHFVYRDTPIARAELCRELGKADRLNQKYSKASAHVFNAISTKLPDALRHAARLERHHAEVLQLGLHVNEQNPSTNIHHLIKELMKLQDAARAE